MRSGASPIAALRERLKTGETDPVAVMIEAQAKADAGALERLSGGTYVTRDTASALKYAIELPNKFPDPETRPPLYGVPVSVKDCFDVSETVTSCGSRFYADRNVAAADDAWIVKRLLEAGAMVTGKTHLHPLAYGITGENPEYGDSLQPRDRTLLTGGSSSGACASVQEGSALAAVGTDTGGSIRVPAALCGLAGYRASHGLFPEEVCWKGGAHLAPSFDTLGLLFEDLRDGPLLGEAVFGLQPVVARRYARIGFVAEEFLWDCDADVLETYEAWKERLRQDGATLEPFDTGFWGESVEVFTTIQASEAAKIHHGNYAHFERSIAERLAGGAAITDEQLEILHERRQAFRVKTDELFRRYDLLMVPCAPVSRLHAGDDQSGARKRILRYTAPISMAGLPAVTLPGEAIGNHFGTGVQMCAQAGEDAALLAFAAGL